MLWPSFTDLRRRGPDWLPRSDAVGCGCYWARPSAQASGDTSVPRSAGLCTRSGDAPAALYPHYSSGSLVSAGADAHTSSAGERNGRRVRGKTCVCKKDQRIQRKGIEKQVSSCRDIILRFTVMLLKAQFDRRNHTHPRHVLPPPVNVMLDPAQHSPVHLLLWWDIQVITGDQIQHLQKSQERVHNWSLKLKDYGFRQT